MKITTPALKTPLAERSAPAAGKASAQAAYAAASGSASTGVDLSAAGRQLSALQDSAQDVDMQKVQALRDAIASGQLKIDTSRIADSLIATARDLLK